MLRIINFFPTPLITWAITCEYNGEQKRNGFQVLIIHDYERFTARLVLERNKALLEDRSKNTYCCISGFRSDGCDVMWCDALHFGRKSHTLRTERDIFPSVPCWTVLCSALVTFWFPYRHHTSKLQPSIRANQHLVFLAIINKCLQHTHNNRSLSGCEIICIVTYFVMCDY
jgi:hypothetical protein